jgi:hypothetical protein
MSIDVNPRPLTVSPPVDRRLFVPSLTHRDIHTRPQHGCTLCPPVPCVCGWTVGTCEYAFEHRRGHAGSESTWREVAA